MNPSLPRRTAAASIGAAAAILLLEGSRAAAGSAFSAGGLLARALFVAAVLAASRFCRPWRAEGGRWIFPKTSAALLAAASAGAVAAAALQSAIGGAVALALFFALTVGAAVPAGGRSRAVPAALRILALAAAAGAVPMAALELECRFAHEELFVALEAALLALVWLALLAASLALAKEREPPRGTGARPALLAAAAAILMSAGTAGFIAAYQASFSDPAPPSFPGISARSPFLCGKAPADPATYGGKEVFDRLLATVAANPKKGPPEEAMLALATGDRRWADRFRQSLAREIARGDLSRHGRTKFWQYAAALRAHYYSRVSAVFPGLFSAAERERAAEWFAAIDRRALAAGIDDVIYGAAYGKRPEGPYENQENGAGLLAAIEAGGLAPPELSAANRRYLDREPRGWRARWRNSDDSFSYQSEWITNAYLQSLRSGPPPIEPVRRSFEWLLLQTPPDGFFPDYNPSGAPALPTAYLGASLLGDPRLLWVAARDLEAAEKHGETMWAQPGVERPVEGRGVAPDVGSCLLYGPSGTPTRVGPLAPDKIVFRGGWREADPYLLVNLRFEGWHRYKATNTVTLLRSGGETLASERGGQPYAFLPLERRLFRDKRIPREGLNGLLVEPTGLAEVLSRLTGFGGPWAQDPPRTARVERFDPGATAGSVTTLSGWRGWTGRRTIVFSSPGPIVVLDEARGRAGKAAAVAWHVDGDRGSIPGRYRLGKGAGELALVPLDGGGAISTRRFPSAPRLDLVYRPVRTGSLGLASVFLTGAWRGSRVSVAGTGAARLLEIRGGGGTFTLPLSPESR